MKTDTEKSVEKWCRDKLNKDDLMIPPSEASHKSFTKITMNGNKGENLWLQVCLDLVGWLLD